MCVITLIDAEERRPSDIMLEMMYERNSDGAGAAWREAQANGENLICWEKGLMKEPGLERMKELAKTLPIPFILHFRIATIGGVKQSMTHPFPIDQRGQNTLTGKTNGYVLFHNGTYPNWENEAKALAISTGIAIPVGKWSDSRAIAWMCSILGNGLMEFMPSQKGLAFGPSGLDVFAGNGWDQVVDPETLEKVWCSNDHFLKKVEKSNLYSVTAYCSVRSCMRKDIDKDGKCPLHTIVKALPPGSTNHDGKALPEVSPSPIPFPPTPKDTDDPQGPLLSMEVAARAAAQGRIGKNFLGSVERTHERLKKGGKEGDRARRTLIICGAMPCFHGLQE